MDNMHSDLNKTVCSWLVYEICSVSSRWVSKNICFREC